MKEMTNDRIKTVNYAFIGHSPIGHFLHLFHKDATFIYWSFLTCKLLLTLRLRMTTPLARILVADDDRTLADVIRFGFVRAHFEVTVAHNGRAALELARNEPFDVVICDFQMPQLNGEQVLTGIRAEGKSQTAALILCTAKGYELEADRLREELHIAAIMLKPFSIVSMVEIAKNCLAEAVVS